MLNIFEMLLNFYEIKNIGIANNATFHLHHKENTNNYSKILICVKKMCIHLKM